MTDYHGHTIVFLSAKTVGTEHDLATDFDRFITGFVGNSTRIAPEERSPAHTKRARKERFTIPF